MTVTVKKTTFMEHIATWLNNLVPDLEELVTGADTKGDGLIRYKGTRQRG